MSAPFFNCNVWFYMVAVFYFEHPCCEKKRATRYESPALAVYLIYNV